MKLNAELYSLVLESAPSMSNRKVYFDELAELDPNYEEQLQIIKKLDIKVKRFKERSTGRPYVRVVEQSIEKNTGAGATSEQQVVKDRTLLESSLPTSDSPAPVSTMSPAESPATNTPEPPEKAEPMTATAVFRAVEIETKQGKKGAKIWIAPATASDALVASRFSLEIGERPFLVFLKPKLEDNSEGKKIVDQAKEIAVKEETVIVSAKWTPGDNPPGEDEIVEPEMLDEDEELEEPLDPTMKTTERIKDELGDQVAKGDLDSESALAQSQLMSKSAGERPVGKRPV